jgi:hypothetical protein
MSFLSGNDDIRSANRGVVKYYSTVTFGATGAVSSQSSKGVTVTRIGTGIYKFAFTEKPAGFLYAGFIVDNKGTVRDNTFEIKTTYTVASGSFEVHLLDGGSAADPTSGDLMHAEITVRNTDF